MDEIVDTNVWLVASHADPASPWKDSSQVSPDEARVVYDWVKEFAQDKSRMLILDHRLKILEEYRHKNTPGNFGYDAWMAKMSTGLELRVVDVIESADGYAEVPDQIAAVLHERTDQVFAAVAIADAGDSRIVNAADTDWSKAQATLQSHGVHVLELLPDFIARHRE